MVDKKKDRQTYATDYIKGDWDKVVYLDSPHTDNLMSAVLNMGAELWAVKRRQLVVERLLDQKGTINRAMVEGFIPSAEDAVAWQAERDEFIERTLGVLTRVADKSYDTAPTKKVPPLKIS
jgi:hypothetical protein